MRLGFAFLLGISILSADVTGDSDPRRRGWIWIADQGREQVFAVSRTGKVVWKKDGLGRVRDVQVTARGTVLVASLEGKIQEIAPSGKILWEHKARAAAHAVRELRNGNLLVAEYTAIIELTKDHKIVWEYKGGTCPEDVESLPNGRVLITWYGEGKIEEVDREKKVAWSQQIRSPMGAQRLKDGTTLVCSVAEQSVAILSSGGKSVWEFQASGDVPYACVTRNGQILLSTWFRIQRVDREKREVWSYDGVSLAVKVREF
jgi:outer membrane protein assembly factor BamB